MAQFFAWTPDDQPAEVIDVTASSAWDQLVDRYTLGRGSLPLERIVEICKQHQVKSILVERRYIDLDWRSEHSRFYSTTYVRYPSVCHRLHFFGASMVTDLGDLSSMREHYKGYSVMRPLPSAPVGRTMIPPPPELADAVRCESTQRVDVLGWPMAVTAMPFVSQDAQYLRCAHADLWMTFFHAHLAQGLPRRTPAEIHDATMGGVVVNRQVPSEGLSPNQMLGGMTALGLSPGFLPLPATAAQSAADGPLGLLPIVCRYVNSNLAPLVISTNHVWLVVAYSRKASQAHPRLTLYRHDDARGPYLPVEDPWNEPEPAHQPWDAVMLPLPPKVYMTGERAEAVGRWWFGLRVRNSSPPDPLVETATAGELTFKTYGLSSSVFKHGLVKRSGMDADVAKHYRLSMWPRNLWIVEAQDRRLRTSGKPAVLGEVVIDPTANHYPSPDEPGILAAHAPGLLWSRSPDFQDETNLSVASNIYDTGRGVV